MEEEKLMVGYKHKNLLVILGLVLLLSMLVTGCSAPQQPADTGSETNGEGTAENLFKVAVILTGPINDAGWNESAYKGLMKAKDTLEVEAAYTENVPQPDFETTIRDYADKGYNLIIMNGFEFTDAAKAVAPQYTDTQFAIVNGSAAQEPNIASFRFDTPQVGFLAGSFAGLITKSNVVGMIGGQKFPHIQDSLTGFEAGAKYVNKDVKVLQAYTDSWTDIPKGKETALAMIDQGADVVCTNANQVGLGGIEAAKSRGKYAVGYIDDQYKVAPGTVPVSAIQSVEDLTIKIIEMAKTSPLIPQTYLLGVKDGVVRLSDFYELGQEPVPDDIKQKMQEIFKGLQDGSLKAQGILPKSSFEK